MATKNTYTEAVGRRKTAVARVRLTEAAKTAYTVNDRPFEELFKTDTLKKIIYNAFEAKEDIPAFVVSAKVSGGGITAQAEALRHGIARALVKYQADLREPLKKAGYLTRDQRAKERRKFGLRKARRAPQWSKR